MCDCNYYKYWEQHLSSAAKVRLTGQCEKPDRRRGLSLADAGRQMADECSKYEMIIADKSGTGSYSKVT